MLTEQCSLYDIYIHFYGLVKSGTKVKSEDYSTALILEQVPFNEEQRLSATIAIDDQRSTKRMRTKSALIQEIGRLLLA